MQSVKETAQKAAEAVQGGAQRVAAALGGGNGRGNDEARSALVVPWCEHTCQGGPAYATHATSPSCRPLPLPAVHQAESSPPPPGEPDLGQADWAKAPAGALEKMRESAAHAVEGVKMRLHLGSHGGEPTAEERTGGRAVCCWPHAVRAGPAPVTARPAGALSTCAASIRAAAGPDLGTCSTTHRMPPSFPAALAHPYLLQSYHLLP